MVLTGYIVLFFTFIAITVILFLPLALILKRKGVGLMRSTSYLLLFLSLFFVIFCTIILFQLPISFDDSHRRILNLQPFKWMWEENIRGRILSEIRPNILIFIPLGFFAPMALKSLRKWQRTVLVVFSLSFSIEFFQYFIGRSSDVDDLMANTLGGLIGYGIYRGIILSLKKIHFFLRN